MYFICSVCKKDLKELPRPLGLCECGKPLEVHYSWENQQRSIDINDDEATLWRYKNVLPEVKNFVSLGEGHTPLIPIGEKGSRSTHLSSRYSIPSDLRIFMGLSPEGQTLLGLMVL